MLVLVATAVLTIAAATTTTAATTAAASAAATTTATAATTVSSAPTTAATLTSTAATATTTAGAGATIESGHVLSLRTLLTLTNLELDLLAFLELAEATALDRGEVHEAIFSAVVRRDETIPLLSIEPLHYACRAHRALSLLAVYLRPLSADSFWGPFCSFCSSGSDRPDLWP